LQLDGPEVESVPDVATDGEAAANLIDAHEEGDADGLGRDPFMDFYARDRAEAKLAPPADRKKLIAGVVAGALVIGAGAAWALGVFSDPEPIAAPVDTKPKEAPAPDAVERSAGVLNALTLDSPQGYEQAMTLAEREGDRAGQAEAALAMVVRYGPDPGLTAQAEQWLSSYAENPAPFVRRVFGLLAVARGDYEGAMAQLADDHVQTRVYRAWAALGAGDHAAATTEAEAVLEADDKNEAAKLILASAKTIADPVGGLDALREAAKANDKHPGYGRDLAYALLRAGMLADAQTIGDTIVGEARNKTFQVSSRMFRARVSQQQGDIAGATRFVDQATNLDENALSPRIFKIQLQIDANRLGEARSEAEALLQKNPGVPEVAVLAASAALAAGQGDAALNHANSIPGAGENAQAQLLIARVHAMRAAMEPARAAFNKARELDPLLGPAAVEHASFLIRQADLGEARRILESQLSTIAETKSMRAPATRSALHRTLARIARESGDLAAARVRLEQALEANPGDNEARMSLISLLAALGQQADHDKLLLELAERTRTYPGLTGPLARLHLRRNEIAELEALIGPRIDDDDAVDDVVLAGARLRLKQGQYDTAKALTQRVRDRSPKNNEAKLILGQILYAQGDYGAALISIEEANPTTPDAETEMWLGRALEAQGQPRDAEAHFKKAVDLEPSNLETLSYYARRVAQSGAPKEAIRLLEERLRGESYAFGYAVLGQAYADLGKKKEAMSYLLKSTQLDPEEFTGWYWQGRLHANDNAHAAAANALTKATKLIREGDRTVESLDTWRRLGRAHKMLGHKGPARAAYQRYLELAPADDGGRKSIENEIRRL
jgi:tetratricopeptide (TPR) repeat protein